MCNIHAEVKDWKLIYIYIDIDMNKKNQINNMKEKETMS